MPIINKIKNAIRITYFIFTRKFDCIIYNPVPQCEPTWRIKFVEFIFPSYGNSTRLKIVCAPLHDDTTCGKCVAHRKSEDMHFEWHRDLMHALLEIRNGLYKKFKNELKNRTLDFEIVDEMSLHPTMRIYIPVDMDKSIPAIYTEMHKSQEDIMKNGVPGLPKYSLVFNLLVLSKLVFNVVTIHQDRTKNDK